LRLALVSTISIYLHGDEAKQARQIAAAFTAQVRGALLDLDCPVTHFFATRKALSSKELTVHGSDWIAD